jgi:hypothetical protein
MTTVAGGKQLPPVGFTIEDEAAARPLHLRDFANG